MKLFVEAGLEVLKVAAAVLGYGLVAFLLIGVPVIVIATVRGALRFDKRREKRLATRAGKLTAAALLLLAFTGCAATVEPESGAEAPLAASCEGRLEGLYRVTYEAISGTCAAPAEALWLANAEAEEPASCHTWRTRSADGCDWYVKRECEDWRDGVRLGRSWMAGTVSAVDWPARLEGTLGVEGWSLDPRTGVPIDGSACNAEFAVTYEKLEFPVD